MFIFLGTDKYMLSLPGIGGHTAAAIGSLALKLDPAVVDGNVARVLSRVTVYESDSASSVGNKAIQEWADEMLIPGRADLSNESLSFSLGSASEKRPLSPRDVGR